jgi:hypothetical protein
VTGFGAGAKVWLSECGSQSAATDAGCGAQMAAQTLVITDDTGTGHATFRVSARAALQPIKPEPAASCTKGGCVIVASLGSGYAFATAAVKVR